MASTSYNQTPSSAASASLPTTWDVFLSFRGIDTRYTFTDHLYSALDRNGIRTFRDDPELRSGEVISDGLLQAIHKSKTYVIVLSENYASSRWCLDELVEILNCYSTMERSVIPIFYNVDPSAAGHQTGSFREAFEKHETRFGKERLDKWRVALTMLGKLSGKVCKNMYEAQFIEEIVGEILLEINPKTLDVAKYPVGLVPRVKELTALLGNGTEGVIRIGLYGMGGMGKTTLAKAFYNHLLQRSFEGCCFLANIREVSATRRGLESLQQQLINDVLRSKRQTRVYNVEEGTMLIRERICSAKILVLIDDLDDLNQYESLVGPFASGSVVIVTTRDEEILEKIDVESRYRYRVNELDDAESLTLFTRHAFENADADNSFKLLSAEILRLAGGLPLALKVFGSHLYKRSKVGWLAYIKKLQKVPDSSIQQRLMISLDALESDDPMLKKLFLDISCLFLGWEIEKVVEILDTYYSDADYYIDILRKRCLLYINNRVLGMHDLLRDIGREINGNNSPDEPGKHSRLWVSKDIEDVLKNHEGTEAIEVIFHRNVGKEHAFAAETFRRIRKLRFLQLTGVNLIGGFEGTLEKLRWLCWEYCPLKCFPSEFNPQKLVVLQLPCSSMIQMWKSDNVGTTSRVYDNLKTLNMSNSSYLIATPDFSALPSLETLNFDGCDSLEELDISIGSLGRLVFLKLRGCRKLRSLPDTICNLRALEVLNIGGCFSVEALPEQLGNIESLKELDAHNVALSKLPDSTGRLSKLVKLILTCHRKPMTIYHKDHQKHKTLKTLPDTICNLRELEVLSVGYSRGLAALPVELGNIESLKELNVHDVIVSKIPDSIGCLINLVKLRFTQNKNLETLPKTIGCLRSLEILDISYCRRLIALPVELGNMESLKELYAQSLPVSELPNSIGHLSKLVKLRLSDNTKLKTLPDAICNLRSLEILDISYCRSLIALPVELGNMESLKELDAHGLAVSQLPNSIGHLSKLVELRLSHNKELITLPDTICHLRSLEILYIDSCSSLTALPADLGMIDSLKELHARCISVPNIPDSVGHLTKLVKLILRGNKNLKTLPHTMSNMRSLETLDIDDCSDLEALPAELGNIDSLKELNTKNVAVSVIPESIRYLPRAGSRYSMT
ncbi:hypothetical protein ACET3Z_030880 [Daucus carota]